MRVRFCVACVCARSLRPHAIVSVRLHTCVRWCIWVRLRIHGFSSTSVRACSCDGMCASVRVYVSACVSVSVRDGECEFVRACMLAWECDEHTWCVCGSAVHVRGSNMLVNACMWLYIWVQVCVGVCIRPHLCMSAHECIIWEKSCRSQFGYGLVFEKSWISNLWQKKYVVSNKY